MPPDPAHLAQHYRDEAARTRALAEMTTAPGMRAKLLTVADQFDRITQQHERHFRDQTKQEPNPERRSILEDILAEQEAKIPADRNRIRHWRMKAEELRAVANQLTNPSTQDAFRHTAATYEKLANDAEARSTGQRPAPTKETG